jgi:hypothetical protein
VTYRFSFLSSIPLKTFLGLFDIWSPPKTSCGYLICFLMVMGVEIRELLYYSLKMCNRVVGRIFWLI